MHDGAPRKKTYIYTYVQTTNRPEDEKNGHEKARSRRERAPLHEPSRQYRANGPNQRSVRHHLWRQSWLGMGYSAMSCHGCVMSCHVIGEVPPVTRPQDRPCNGPHRQRQRCRDVPCLNTCGMHLWGVEVGAVCVHAAHPVFVAILRSCRLCHHARRQTPHPAKGD